MKKTSLIPTPENMLLPILKTLAGYQAEVPVEKTRTAAAVRLKLSSDALKEHTKSGQNSYELRFNIAITYLVRAEFVMRQPISKTLFITKAGRKFAAKYHQKMCSRADVAKASPTFARFVQTSKAIAATSRKAEKKPPTSEKRAAADEKKRTGS